MTQTSVHFAHEDEETKEEEWKVQVHERYDALDCVRQLLIPLVCLLLERHQFVLNVEKSTPQMDSTSSHNHVGETSEADGCTHSRCGKGIRCSRAEYCAWSGTTRINRHRRNL